MRKIDLIELTLQRIKYPCMIKTNFFLYKKYLAKDAYARK